MTKFLDKTFSSRPATEAYRDNWDTIFGKRDIPSERPTEPALQVEGEPTKPVRFCGVCKVPVAVCECHKTGEYPR